MVNKYGRWIPEADYSTYPKENWCDYDYMAVWIRKQGYEPKTSMENLISMIFVYYEGEIENHVSDYDTESGNFEGTYVEACQSFVEDSEALVNLITNLNILLCKKKTEKGEKYGILYDANM